MKKALFLTLGTLFAGAVFAQHYDRDDAVLTPEQLKMTAEAAPKKLAVVPKKVRRFLIWDRTDGYRHTEGIPAFNALIKELAKNSGGKWELTFADDPKAFELDNLKKYDCVVLNNTTGRFFAAFKDEREKMSGEQKKADEKQNIKYRDNLIKYVEEGGGIMGMHAACDAMDCKDNDNPNEKFPAYPVMMGGRFAGHPWGAGNPAVTVLVEDPTHTIVKGLWENAEFKIQDEIYTFREEYGYDRNAQRVLLSLDFDRSPRGDGRDPMLETQRKNKDFGLSWVKKYGKGRIFYGAFGHRLDVYWRNPKICEMYMRGLQFASGDLDNVDTTPLGNEPMLKAQANAAVNAIYSLREIKYGDGLGAIEPVFFKTYQAVLSNKETLAKVEKVCVAELKAKSGTNRYQKMLSELLQITGANNCAEEIGEIIVRDAPNAKKLFYVESLFISLGRTDTPQARGVLGKLANSKIDFIARDAVSALAYKKNPAVVAPISAILKKSLSVGDDRMSQTAARALAFIGSEASYEALAASVNSAKSPLIKSQIQGLLMMYSSANPKLALKLAGEFATDKSADLGVRELAAIELVKNGKEVPADINLRDVITYLGKHKDVKIPASFALAKLPQDVQAEMIYALVKRGEGYESIIALTPSDAGTARAITYAVSEFGKIADLEKIAAYADMYDGKEMRDVGFVIASIKAKNKLRIITDLSKKLQGKPRELMVAAMSNLDASSCADYLFEMVESGSEADKLAALKTLENAALKNTEVFARASELYIKAPESLKRSVLKLMVVCSRRDCNEDMIKAAVKLFNAVQNPKEKAQFMRFASANNAEAGAKMCVMAYKAGLKEEALAEIQKWNNASAFNSLIELDKSVKKPVERKAVQSAIIKIISNSGEVESDGAKYILSNAVDKSFVKVIEKMQRLNLANVKLENLGAGIKGTAFRNAGELKNAFDGNRGTRWSSGINRAAGQWIQFELPNARLVRTIVLDHQNSDGVLAPKVYAGEGIEDFDEVPLDIQNEKGKVLLKFKKPVNVKLVRIENNGESGGWWSIHEVGFIDDPSIYKRVLKPIKNGILAGANRNQNSVGQMFDGSIGSRWSTDGDRQPGQWIMLGFEKPRTVSQIDLLLGESTGDRVLAPKVFVGDNVEDMKEVEIKATTPKGRDSLIFAKPVKTKYIRIENGRASGGFWSVHEIEIK